METTKYLLELSKSKKIIALPEEDTVFINNDKIEVIGTKPYYLFDKCIKKKLNTNATKTLFNRIKTK